MRRLAGPKATHFEVCSILGLFLLGEEYWDRPVAGLSGGEKSRLLLASLFAARANFLVLDEPTNHLDLESREALVRALNEYSGTLLFVAHDRRLMAEAASEVWAVGEGGLQVFSRGFQEYDDYRCQTLADGCAADKAAITGRASPGRASRREEKERRRLEAERRNALSRKLKPLREKYAALERELETVLARQGALEQSLADPETYAKAEEFSRVSREYGETERRIEELLHRLEALEGEITALEAPWPETA